MVLTSICYDTNNFLNNIYIKGLSILISIRENRIVFCMEETRFCDLCCISRRHNSFETIVVKKRWCWILYHLKKKVVA